MEETKWNINLTSTLIISLISFTLFFKLIKNYINTRGKNKPPRPPPLPPIGHLHLIKEPLHQIPQLLSSTYGDVLLLRLGRSSWPPHISVMDIFSTNRVEFFTDVLDKEIMLLIGQLMHACNEGKGFAKVD